MNRGPQRSSHLLCYLWLYFAVALTSFLAGTQSEKYQEHKSEHDNRRTIKNMYVCFLLMLALGHFLKGSYSLEQVSFHSELMYLGLAHIWALIRQQWI